MMLKVWYLKRIYTSISDKFSSQFIQWHLFYFVLTSVARVIRFLNKCMNNPKNLSFAFAAQAKKKKINKIKSQCRFLPQYLAIRREAGIDAWHRHLWKSLTDSSPRIENAHDFCRNVRFNTFYCFSLFSVPCLYTPVFISFSMLMHTYQFIYIYIYCSLRIQSISIFPSRVSRTTHVTI